MSSEKSRRVFDLLGICIKAGKAVKGFDSVIDAVKNGIACCVLTACDASGKTVKEIAFYCDKYGVKLLETGLSKADMGRLFHKDTAAAAVTDNGFARGFEKILLDLSQ